MIFPTIMVSPFISNSKDKCPNINSDIIDSKLSKNGIYNYIEIEEKSYYYYSFIRKTFFVLTKNCPSNEIKKMRKNYIDGFCVDIPSLSNSDFNLIEEEIDFIKSNKNINRLIQLILVNL